MGLSRNRQQLQEQLRDYAKQIFQLKRGAAEADPYTKAAVYEKIESVREREAALRYHMKMLELSGETFWGDLKKTVSDVWTTIVSRMSNTSGKSMHPH